MFTKLLQILRNDGWASRTCRFGTSGAFFKELKCFWLGKKLLSRIKRSATIYSGMLVALPWILGF